MNFDFNAYCKRIALELNGSESETDRLKKIHLHHITHIPFEALAPYMGHSVEIAPDKVFEKMVLNGRGGYCFEHNSLLCSALNAAGIATYGVQARVSGPDGFGGQLHRMNIATADGTRYVADVGFGGDCFVLPLELRPGIRQSDGRNTYRVVELDNSPCRYAVQILRGDKFENMLGFNDIAGSEDDFEIGNYYTSSNPKSAFRTFLMCARPTMEGGKYTLFGKHASATDATGNIEHFDLEGEELLRFISEKLGINTDGLELEVRE